MKPLKVKKPCKSIYGPAQSIIRNNIQEINNYNFNICLTIRM